MKKSNVFTAVFKVLGIIIKYGALLTIIIETVEFFRTKMSGHPELKKLVEDQPTETNA